MKRNETQFDIGSETRRRYRNFSNYSNDLKFVRLARSSVGITEARIGRGGTKFRVAGTVELVQSGRTPRWYGTGRAHPSCRFSELETAPTGSLVLFPSRMPVILVLAHRIHVLRGAAVGQEFDGLQPCKAGRRDGTEYHVR